MSNCPNRPLGASPAAASSRDPPQCWQGEHRSLERSRVESRCFGSDNRDAVRRSRSLGEWLDDRLVWPIELDATEADRCSASLSTLKLRVALNLEAVVGPLLSGKFFLSVEAGAERGASPVVNGNTPSESIDSESMRPNRDTQLRFLIVVSEYDAETPSPLEAAGGGQNTGSGGA